MVLPFVPVTPTVGHGHRRRKRSISLTTGTRPAASTSARAARRRGSVVLKRLLTAGDVGDERLAAQDLRRVDGRAKPELHRAPLEGHDGRLQLVARALVVDGHLRAAVGQEARQGDAAAGEAKHGHGRGR